MLLLQKSIIILVLLVFFALSAPGGQVSALEIKWPPVPGAVPPQEIIQRPQSEQMGLLFNYFVHFFFLLAFLATIISLISAGVAYFFSGPKPASKAYAKQWISQSFLGFFILLSSYLVLSVINPQLLVFKMRVGPVPKTEFTLSSVSDAQKISYLQIPIGTILSKTLSDLAEKKDYKGKKYFSVEEPIVKIEETLSAAIEEMKNLEKKLKKCQCGTTKYHISAKKGKGKCLPGRENPQPVKTDQDACLNFCSNCGTSGSCDRRQVRRNPDNPDLIEIQKSDGSWRKIKEEDKKTAINYSVLQIIDLLARLQAQSATLSSDQIDLIAKNLAISAGELLTSRGEAVVSQDSFLDEKETLEKENYTVEIKRPKQFPEAETVHMSPAALDPFTFYLPIKGGLFPPSIIQQNQETYRESQRASIFAVLSGISIEDIEQMVGECLFSAFGSKDFSLNSAALKPIVSQAVKQGIADFLGEFISSADSEDYAYAFLNQLRQGIKEKIDNPETKQKLKNECASSCSSAANKETCLAACQKETIPLNFLSNKLADLFTKKTKELLPKEIKKTLQEKTRKVFLSKKANEILGNDTIELLDKASKGALKKSLKNQSPYLKNNLEKTLNQVLPEIVLSPLQSIDYFIYKNIKNLKKNVAKEINKIAEALGKMLSKPIEELIENYKKSHPGTFVENQDPEECWQDFDNGYYYDYASKVCVRASLKEIQDYINGKTNSKIAINIGTAEAEGHWDTAYEESPEMICLNAGFCWNYKETITESLSGECRQGDPGCFEVDVYKCEKCAWRLSDWNPFSKANFKRLLTNGFKALVNFAEKFALALIETATYTLSQYSQVWVEDNIIAPAQPYLSQMVDFQKKLHKALYSSIEQLLPSQLRDYLNSNIDQILSKLCSASKQTPTGGKIRLAEDFDIEVSKEAGEKACNLHEELHKSILERLKESCVQGDKDKNENSLGCQIGLALDDSFYNLLCAKFKENPQNPKNKEECVLSFLNKSFAQILFPELADKIEAIIKGTPKQAICSELPGQPYKKICGNIKSSVLTGRLLPYPKNSSEWNKLNSNEKAYCYFLWYACEPVLSSWSRGIGEIIKAILTNNCQDKDTDFCRATVKDSIAYSVFYYGLQKYPPADEEEEIETYQWLTVLFPKLISDIDKLARTRGLSGKWTSGSPSPRQQALEAHKLNDLPVYRQKGNAFAKSFVAWFARNKKMYDILTDINFGIMQSFREGSSSGQKNIFAETPYSFLSKGICKKIKDEFLQKYPDLAFSRVQQRLRPGNQNPYSMGSISNPTTADVLLEILNSQEAPFGEITSYALCLSLEYTPAAVFGLDQKLVRYVQPKEYQILFELMEKELTPDERPEGLNKLLFYLYQYKPTTILGEIGVAKQNRDMIKLHNFLTERIGDQINRGYMNKKMIEIIFAELFDSCRTDIRSKNCPLYRPVGWENWKNVQQILSKSPADIAALALKKPLIKADWAQRSLLAQLADPDNRKNSGDETVLGKRYIDVLGRALGLDKPIYQLYLKTEDFYSKVDEAVKKGKEVVQKSIDKAFLEYPFSLVKKLSSVLVKSASKKIGEDAAKSLAGVCRKAEKEGDCSTEEIFNKETKECCSLGGNLVCQPRCHPKEKDEECDLESGEFPSADNSKCCFDEKCRKCRLISAEEKTCRRHNEEKDPRPITIDDEEKNLCCKPRMVKKSRDGSDLCCVSIVECINDKFNVYLTKMGMILQDGPPLNELSK